MIPVADLDFSAGEAAIQLAEHAGLILDPWQKHVLKFACIQRANGTWAAFEVGLIVGRQNGKGSILEARELAGLFIFGDRLQLHSSHEFKTTGEAFRRIRELVENTDDLRKQVKKITTSHGEEGIELKNGNRLRFVARSTGSGRGFTVDTVYWDEAYNLGPEAKAALMPTLSSVPNPQLWYTSSAGWGISTALSDVRQRAVNPHPDDARLYFAEWSADPDDYDIHSEADWALANPGLGIRITADFVKAELAAMRHEPALFARERLSIGQWPTGEAGWQVISKKEWDSIALPLSAMADPVALAVDVTPDRSWGSIAAAGNCGGTTTLVELVEHAPGTDWVIPRLVELVKRQKPSCVVLAPNAPAGGLLANLERALEDIGRAHLLAKPTQVQCGQACVAFYDAAVKTHTLAHRAQDDLAASLAGAKKKETTEGLWTFNRRSIQVDISPLWSATLALWGYQAGPRRPKPFALFS